MPDTTAHLQRSVESRPQPTQYYYILGVISVLLIGVHGLKKKKHNRASFSCFLVEPLLFHFHWIENFKLQCKSQLTKQEHCICTEIYIDTTEIAKLWNHVLQVISSRLYYSGICISIVQWKLPLSVCVCVCMCVRICGKRLLLLWWIYTLPVGQCVRFYSQ